MITTKPNPNHGYDYSTTQTSSDSTIDTYWDIVNNRYLNIHNKVSYAYDADWIDGCISDCEWGIKHCDKPFKNTNPKLVAQYKASFQFIINELNKIKAELA